MAKSAKASILIKADGSVEAYLPDDGLKFSYEEARELVGGYIERLRLYNFEDPTYFEMYLLVDGNGIPRGLPFNKNASQISGKPIYGDALWMSKEVSW